MHPFRNLVAAATITLVVTHIASASLWNAADDFSSDTNPTGVWTYGYANSLGGSFVQYSSTFDYGNMYGQFGLDAWNRGPTDWPDLYPLVWHNGTGTTILFSTVTSTPNMLALAPGPSGQYSVVRFTAPTGGAYTIDAVFRSEDDHVEASPDVAILLNSGTVVDRFLTRLQSFAYDSTLVLSTGDTVDFAVGWGNNGSNIGDTGSLSLMISVPEPAALSLLALGGLAMIRRRRGRLRHG